MVHVHIPPLPCPVSQMFSLPKKQRYRDLDTLAPGPASHPYWFEDGDLVLGVEDVFFKIHSKRLGGCSGVFGDMLEAPRPMVIESVDGCPLVRLEDGVKDWMTTLEFMYDPV